jgi:peptide/nickel transport system permease protein
VAPLGPVLEFPVTDVSPAKSSAGSRLGRFVVRQPMFSAGVLVLILILVSGVLAPLWWTGDPQQMKPIQRLQPPSAQHWFGSDHFGRDVYTRTLYGARISLVVGAAVSVLSLVLGTGLGLVIGFYRRLDTIMMRVMDGLMAIPAILLALALMAMVRASVRNVIIALVIPEIPRVIRVVRASVLSLREHTMVEAARALGVGTPRVLVRYILPGLVAPLVVQATYVCASAILFEAYLSFLGAGTPPHIPSWGNIMAEGKTYVQLAFWIILFPGLFLALTVLAINLVGDGLRELLDVRS